MIPTPEQTRAARGLLNMSRDHLAKISGVSVRALAAYETGESRLMRLNHEAVRQTLEEHGVEFLLDTGVRLKR